MIPMQQPEKDLPNLLRRMAVAPNDRVLTQAFDSFQNKYPKGFPFENFDFNHDVSHTYPLARARLRRMENVPEPLQLLMARMQECFYNSLRINSVVLSNLEKLIGEGAFDKSCIDSYISIMGSYKDKVTFSDIRFLFGSDWGFNTLYDGANFEPLHTLKIFFSYVNRACERKVGTQFKLWKESGLAEEGSALIQKLKLAKKGNLIPPTLEALTELQTTQKTLFVPTGYANHNVFYIHLIAIDYSHGEGYRLRLLTTDGASILPAGSKENHFCPEVVWTGLELKQLTDSNLWKPLLEAATLTVEELTKEKKADDDSHVLAFDALHLVPFLIRRLGTRPKLAFSKVNEDCWTSVLSNRWNNPTCVYHNVKSYPEPGKDQEADILLRPTDKQMRHPICTLRLHKFVNLLPLELLKSRNDRLLFKAESRLLLLTGAYLTLREGNIPYFTRGNFLTLVENSFGKVTAPIERLMRENPTEEEKKAALILLSSLLDLKNRLAEVVYGMDRITLAAPKPLYRSTHVPHRLQLSRVVWTARKEDVLDSLRIDDGVAPLPLYQQWTAERFAVIYDSLEKWYDILLDAKKKCEPLEIVTLAHRNVFSKLPIPLTDKVEDTFPEPLSEGLQVGTLLILKKISSLVASEVYSDDMVPSVFIADMARVYRFSCELYRKINPAVQKLPISWFSLYQYMENRHSFHSIGDVKVTLDALVNSFKLISPEGYKRTSDQFQEIPLFYFSWDKFPTYYKFHRKTLGPLRQHHKSVDEVLSIAELADSVGLRPDEIEKEWRSNPGSLKWENSFAGQCFLATKEIAQYYTVSVHVSVSSYLKTLNEKYYRRYSLFENMGPEDHFQLEPPYSTEFTEYLNHFTEGEVYKDVESGETPMSQRMVVIHEEQIRKPISDIPYPRVDNWRAQAELIKVTSKGNAFKGAYQLNQIASGPSGLSLDVLLEYFEARSSLLLSVDYRSYFWGIVRSQHILEDACTKEPLLFNRFHAFIAAMYEEDRKSLETSNLNFERMLWLSAVTRHLCQISPVGEFKFTSLLEKMVADLRGFGKGQPAEVRIAPHMLASQKWLKTFKLTIPEIARFHLIFGRQPPPGPNDAVLRLEALDAMYTEAPRLQEALLHGEAETRYALWSLILDSDEMVLEVLNRETFKVPLSTLLKTHAQVIRLNSKILYLLEWQNFCKKYSWRDYAWRAEATIRVSQKVIPSQKSHNDEIDNILKEFTFKADKCICATPTSLVIQLDKESISLDWETGRLRGGGKNLPVSKVLPVYLRKLSKLAPLGEILRRPLVRSSDSLIVQFQGIPFISLNLFNGDAWITHDGQDYHLISDMDLKTVEQPEQLNEGFSVWLNDKNEGVIAAHEKNGMPHPVFLIDNEGIIRPIKGNTNLRLASDGYYPEAQLFARWNLAQKDIFVWLDDNNNVAELHIPLHNGHDPFTRVIRTDDDEWMIDGLKVRLESTTEAVPAFAGHPVYLVARNSENQRLLLLPGATPYIMRRRRVKKENVIDWNKILTVGDEEGIHQYRILPSGQIEGLTVADNLLLMLWTMYMGHYPRTADLVLRWLTPPGRSYTEEEQRILLTWLSTDYSDHPMENEKHPSAVAIRLYVIARMARHLRDYPPERKEGEKMPLLWLSLIGPRYDSYKSRDYIAEKISDRSAIGRQVRSTQLDELLSKYDHETLIRLTLVDDLKRGTELERKLYQRLNDIRSVHVPQATRVTCKIHGREIRGYGDEPKWGKYTLQHIIDGYPTQAQTSVVPIEELNRRLVGPSLISFFDKAYTLIKEGPKNPAEAKEYSAIIHALGQLRDDKMIDICISYLWISHHYHSEEVFESNILLWLLLEQAFLAQNAGLELPNLPSMERRFGVVIEGSKQAAKDFFHQLVDYSGEHVGALMTKYRKAWFDKRAMRYLEQQTVTIDIPQSFGESLFKPKSDQLTSEISRWSKLSAPVEPKGLKLEVALPGWSFSIPAEWGSIEPTEQSLHALRPQLQEKLNELRTVKTQREKSLLNLAATLPKNDESAILMLAGQIHYNHPLTIDECIGMALIGQSDHWNKYWKAAKSRDLQRSTLEYLEAALEEAHLERAVGDLERCLKNPDDQEQMQQMLEALKTPHKYLPSTETIDLMASEYYSNCRLRTQPDQAHHIEVLTREPGKYIGSVIQAIMGSGKSKMLAPMWLQKMLGTGRIPILCVPSSIFRTTLSDLQNMMWKRFRTHVRALTFDRESCTSETLYNLAEKFYVGRQEPTVFVCSPRDLHALQLMLKERHEIIENMRERLKRYTLIWAKSCLNAQELEDFSKALDSNLWDEAMNYVPYKEAAKYRRWLESHNKMEEELKPLFVESDLLQAILNLLQNEAALLVDEVAQCYDPRNLLSFPIGWQIQANPAAAAMGCKVYFEWLPQCYDRINLLNNTQSFTDETTRGKIYREITRMAYTEYKELIPNFPDFDLFKYYMFSNPKKGRPMKKFVKELNEGKSQLMKQYAQELAFLKYCISSGLDGALTSTAFVNYGRSKQDPHLYLAIPYQCANVPKENTLFRRPWKTIMMTCQLYSQCWSDPHQTAELIGFLQGIDPASKDHNILEAAKTIWGRRFGDIDLSDTEAMKGLTSDLDEARLNPVKAPAARLLIQTFLRSCVFPTQLKLDPSQLTSTPQDLPMMPAKSDAMGGTFGFETTWNPRLQRVPDHSCDETIIRALKEPRNQTCHVLPKGGVETFFALMESGAFDEYMALVDTGALFKGITNTKVAERFLRCLKGFDCILFWDEEQPGGARLSVMTRAGKKVLEQSDREGVRRALSQMNLKKPFAYYDQDRRIGYDLELPRGKGLITFSNIALLDDILQSALRYRLLLLGFQSIAYVIPGEMEGEWCGNRVLEVSDVQQKTVEKKANFHGICEQMRGEVRAKIDHAMRATASQKERHEIHLKSKSYLMEEQDNNLVKTFGSLQKKVESGKALLRLKEQLILKTEQIISQSKNRRNVRRSLDAILAFHQERKTALPEFVREGDEQEDAVQEVDISKEQDRMRLMEEEYERMLGSRNPKDEIKWERFAPEMISPSPLGCISASEDMPALYSLRESIKERGYSVPISENVLISSNLLATFLGETNCLLTDNQKPVHRCLYVRDAHETKLVLVTEGDANFLKEHLLKFSNDKGDRVYLVEPSGAINQRGCVDGTVVNLWKDGTVDDRILLLQALVFQGSALIIDQLPEAEVEGALEGWAQGKDKRKMALKILFEAALDFRPDDMLLYRRSQKLRGLFNAKKK